MRARGIADASSIGMLRVAVLLLLAAGAAVARHRDQSGTVGRDPSAQDRGGSATLTSSTLTTRDIAVDKITAARCAREVTCSNIGPDRRYPANDKCVAEVKERLDRELGPNECPDGIDGKQVDECLDAIRAESCTNPMSTVQRLAECRTSSLCVKPHGRPLL